MLQVIAASYNPVMERYVGLKDDGSDAQLDQDALQKIIAVKLAAKGFALPASLEMDSTLNVASDLFRVYREQSRLLDQHLCPIDQRIQNFLEDVLKATSDDEVPKMPTKTLESDRWGLARVRGVSDRIFLSNARCLHFQTCNLIFPTTTGAMLSRRKVGVLQLGGQQLPFGQGRSVAQPVK